MNPSLMRVLPALPAQALPRSSLTVMLPIHTAATAAMRLLIKATEPSTARKPLLSLIQSCRLLELELARELRLRLLLVPRQLGALALAPLQSMYIFYVLLSSRFKVIFKKHMTN